MDSICALYVNLPNEQFAKEICAHLVEKKLVRTINSYPAVLNTHEWGGKVKTGNDYIIYATVLRNQVQTIISEVKRKWKKPNTAAIEAIAMPIVDICPGFLKYTLGEECE